MDVRLEKGNVKSPVWINKCFNTVRVMINDKAFVIGNLKTIAEAMNPLFAHMKNVEKIDFDEDLISIMTNIIRHLKSIPDFGFEFLIYLYKYLEKVGGMFLDLYELMNVYIVYGGKIIEQNQNYLEAIINIFNASMNNIKNKKSKNPRKILFIVNNFLLKISYL